MLTRIIRLFALGPSDQNLIDSLTVELSARLDIFDKILSRQHYTAGMVRFSPFVPL
jgi:hypothetical protein